MSLEVRVSRVARLAALSVAGIAMQPQPLLRLSQFLLLSSASNCVGFFSKPRNPKQLCDGDALLKHSYKGDSYP